MKIGFTCYPMLWQRAGGLQTQIHQTLQAICEMGPEMDLEVRLIDFLSDKLSDFDVVHVFAIQNGNHRIVQEAQNQRVPVVLSPLIHPEDGPVAKERFHLASRLTGRMTGYNLKTNFDDFKLGLQAADHLIALSDGERRSLIDLYDQTNDRITIIGNGISEHFFEATPDLFRATQVIPEPFLFVVGSISPYKNQLGVIRASAPLDCPVVLMGPVADDHYMQQCLREGGERVQYLGTEDHASPMLASAYAAAGVTILASAGESFGLTAVEALASGTPAIITRNNGLGIPESRPHLSYIDPDDLTSLTEAIKAALKAPPHRQVHRKLVEHMRWATVAKSLMNVYSDLLKRSS